MTDTDRIIDKYQPLWGAWIIDGLIDQGSYGEIYKVYKEEWGKKYISAVKLISIKISKNDMKEAREIGIDVAYMPEYFKNFVSNITNEIEVMYKLRGNSNIVTYEDHAIYEKKSEIGWDILIRMEFLQSLPDYMTTHALTRGEVIQLGIDICKALEACEKENIIHRDVRDANIFVTEKGDFKLGNFGIAKELSKISRTASSQVNPLFMAPEVYKEQNYDAAIDTYSLGIVMYKLLNRGRLPFLPLAPHPISANDTENAIRSRMSGNELTLPIDVDGKLGGIILKACCYNQKDRYKSPSEFRQKLERLSKSEVRMGKSMSTPNLEVNKQQAEVRIINLSSRRQMEAETVAIRAVATIDKTALAVKQSKKKLKLVVGASIILCILGLTLGFSIIADSSKALKKTAVESASVKPNHSPTIIPTVTKVKTPDEPTTAPTPADNTDEAVFTNADSGKEYYYRGMAYLKNKQYEKALRAFVQAKKFKYDKTKVDKQIKQMKNIIEVQAYYNKAIEYYTLGHYEKAISSFIDLVKADPSYKTAPQYADSFFQLATKHNMAGIKYYNDSKPEEAVKEFDLALSELAKMSSYVSGYDVDRYSKLTAVCKENKNEVQFWIKKIDEYLKLAEASNRSGVKHFNEKNSQQAKLEFENAVKYIKELHGMVPKHLDKSYEGLLQIYENNLKRAGG
ncbi:MAG: protein kinase, partial [Rhizobium sp.]|nr:protein kinase [Rhizobium sp.]